jgi:hypothetical protein
LRYRSAVRTRIARPRPSGTRNVLLIAPDLISAVNGVSGNDVTRWLSVCTHVLPSLAVNVAARPCGALALTIVTETAGCSSSRGAAGAAAVVAAGAAAGPAAGVDVAGAPIAGAAAPGSDDAAAAGAAAAGAVAAGAGAAV